MFIFKYIIYTTMDHQYSELLKELLYQALKLIHSGEPGVDSLLYKAIYVLKDNEIMNSLASCLHSFD
ncbi:MAG: hypothetical protein CL681_01740 [Blastopirellula sp.]|nr:hypothetical protein [Blastopirellula sp.]MAR08681.1 hypothetical protein [Blastopirellula sp.]